MACRTLLRGVVIVTCVLGAVSAVTAKRVYHIGNSLTDEVKYELFKGMAESRGHTHVIGSHRVPGTPLGWLWNNPDHGFTHNPYGRYYDALTGYDWDALVLQPFQWGYRKEAAAANKYMALATRRYPQTIVYIHMTWPLNKVDDYGSFETQWLSDETATNRSRKYFEFVADSLKTNFGADHVYIIPNGEVFYEIDERIRAGTFTHLSSIWDLYSDAVHVTDIGSFIVACTHYAVIYQDDPVGLPTTGFDIAADFAADLQQIIKEVVLSYAPTGVTSFGPYPVTGVSVLPASLELSGGRTATLGLSFTPSNATNKSVSWSTTNGSVATVSDAGVVSAVAAGTVAIVATTADGGFKDTCEVTVPSGGTPVDGVTVSPDADTVLVGNTVTYAASVSPSNATNASVTWRVLDTSVASVNASGVVTGKAKGKTRVMVTTVNGALSDTARLVVTIPNNPPVPVLKANPIDGYVNTAYRFSASASSDPDPNDFVLGYDWDLGDGSPINYSVSPWHTYTETGNYTVRLRVMDNNDARSDWVSQEVSVMARHPGVLVYEGFEAPLGRNLRGLVSGYGWHTSAWSGPEGGNDDEASIASAHPLRYGSLTVRGNYLAGPGGGRRYRGFDLRNDGELAAYLTSGKLGKADSSLWFSVLIRKERANDNKVAVRLHSNRYDCCDTSLLEIGYLGSSSNDGGSRYWSININGSITRSTSEVTAGEAVLLVAELTWAASRTSVDLYVNPSELGGQPPASPTLHAQRDCFNSYHVLSLSAGVDDGAFDEFRLGSTFEDVTPTGTVVQRPRAVVGNREIRAQLTVNGRCVRGCNLPAGASLELLDLAGRVLARSTQTAGVSVLHAPRPGMYVLRLTTPDGVRLRRMMIP